MSNSKNQSWRGGSPDLVIQQNERSITDLAKQTSQRSLAEQTSLKIFTGTSPGELDKAERTYLNELGPGQYNLPPLTGRHSLESKRRNIPLISFGSKTKAPWHNEFHTDFVGQTSPPSTRYSPKKGKTSNESSTSKLGRMGSEKKFREPSSVTKLRQSMPVQYGGQYDIDSCNNGFKQVLKRVNGKTLEATESLHHDMKRTYRQVSMGFGKRSDFTKVPQQKHDPGFVYDQSRLSTIKDAVSRHKQVNNKSTFGASFSAYDKSMISDGLAHWHGRGPACDMANDGTDLKMLKKRVQSFADSKNDRGLLIRGSVKDQKTSKMPGPGAYNTIEIGTMVDQMKKQVSRRNPVAAKSNMSRASRDVSFSKFASGNAGIYARGLF